MTPGELHILASSVYGPAWQSPLARDMGVALRSVQRWASPHGDGVTKTATAESIRRFLDERRLARLPAPPEGTDPNRDEDTPFRDDAAYNAMEPPLRALLATAVDRGWNRAEAEVAMLNVLAELMRESTGTASTIETLREAARALHEARDT